MIKNSVIFLVAIFCGCMSIEPRPSIHYKPGKVWHVNLTDGAAAELYKLTNIDADEFYHLLLPKLRLFYRRWGVEFSRTTGDAQIDIWVRNNKSSNDLGCAYFYTRDITKRRNTGVFINNVLQSGCAYKLDKSQLIFYIASIVSHEIGHSYGLQHVCGDEGYKQVMYGGGGNPTGRRYGWSLTSIHKLDKVFNVRK